MKVAFSPAARRDRLEAMRFYMNASERAAAGFDTHLRAAVAFVLDFPNAGSPIDERYRHKPLTHYPFSVVYRIEDDTIYVVAVAHHKRESWRTRLR